MISHPLVSVIIPAYNCDRYLAEAVESILNQTYTSFEVIIIDDGSTDKTAEVAKSFGSKVTYCYQNNGGSATARNHGIELAQGSFLAFLDADDLWVEDKLAVQLEAFKNDPELHLVFGQVQQFYSPDLAEELKATIYCNSELMPGYIPSAMLVKKESFFQIGEFESKWKCGEFAAWYVQAVESGLKTLTLPKLVAKRRLHSANKGIKQKDEARLDYVRILKASLDRRRAEGLI